jgi:hypothetical protein
MWLQVDELEEETSQFLSQVKDVEAFESNEAKVCKTDFVFPGTAGELQVFNSVCYVDCRTFSDLGVLLRSF